MKRISWLRGPCILLVLSLMLSGCAIPLAVTLATSAIEVIITATTGKEPTDHVLSAVMMQDCVLFRVAEGKQICIDNPGDAARMDPKQLKIRVRRPDGTEEVQQVVRVQPVYDYSDMPRTNEATAQDVILNSRPRQTPNPNLGGTVDNLPEVQ